MPEEDRLKALEEFEILDTLPEKEFDDIVELASALCNTPISMITLIDSDRQWFKATFGIEAKETPREYSFCQYAIEDPYNIMVVEDALLDDRLKSNPFVVGEPKIRFYAGAPLVTSDDQALGTLCIIDDQPRKLGEEEKRILGILASKVMSHLELRKENLLQKRKLDQVQNKLKITLGRLIEAQNMAKIGSWDWNLRTNDLYWSPQMYQIFGLKRDENKKLIESWQALVHPDDLGLVRNAIKDSLQAQISNSIQYRILYPDGSKRWVETQGHIETNESGNVTRLSGTVQDITERKKSQQDRNHYSATLTQMLFDLSHKIRQPLTNYMALIDILDGSKSEKHKEEYFHLLKTSALKFDEFIREMSDFIYEHNEEIKREEDQEMSDPVHYEG